MNLTNKTIFVSGANRGIGKAIVEALLNQPVAKVYAAARKLSDLPNFNDPRVVPIQLDITKREQIAAAAKNTDVDLLINNAGVANYSSVVSSDTSALMADMQVNYFGTLSMVNAFAPALEARKGAIANVISVVGLASIAGFGGYSASKAALFSATQAMRAELKGKGVSVIGIFPGPIDTDMAKDVPLEKTSPANAAEKIIAGLLVGAEDIFPDVMSIAVGQTWASDPKGLERQFASM